MENIYCVLINVALENAKEYAEQLNENVFNVYCAGSTPLKQIHNRVGAELGILDHEMTYINVLSLYDFVELYNNQSSKTNDYIAMVSITLK